jgi:hypothetical protein
MALNKNAVMHKTHYGLDVYALILRKYYKDKLVLKLRGKACELTANPFSSDSKSLKIELKDGMFCYEDVLHPEFRGDVFDFANLYYKTDEKMILKNLNTDLNLRLGEERDFYKLSKREQHSKLHTQQPSMQPALLDEQLVELPRFSLFKKPISNTKPYKTISVLDVYGLIKGPWNIQRTQTLRQIRDVEEARAFKANEFNYVSLSGIFGKRSDKHLKQHSGLMVLDFDHLSDVDGVKKKLLADESLETVLLFRSPSGDGLKCVIEIDISHMDHKNYFKAVSNYLMATYQLEVDGSGKDVSRACFLPYDPEVFINPKYLVYGKDI